MLAVAVAMFATGCGGITNGSTANGNGLTGSSATDATVCESLASVIDGGGLLFCPSDMPASGAPCSPSGFVCTGYGAMSAPTTATCSASCTWNLTTAPPFGLDAGPSSCSCVAGHPAALCPDGSLQPYLGHACQPDGSCGYYWGPCPEADGGVEPALCMPSECGSLPGGSNPLCGLGPVAGPLCVRRSSGVCEWISTDCPDAGASAGGLVATLIGAGDGTTAECPGTLPTLKASCPRGGLFCDYTDPTTSDTTCRIEVYCQGTSGWSLSTDASMYGCPAAAPVDGTSCACGWHLLGESFGGSCSYTCGAGEVVATCSGGGTFAAAGADYSRWHVASSCALADAGAH
ncbi:MAG: hypothetical protein ACHREM_01195 [Polyangiales bacterium]